MPKSTVVEIWGNSKDAGGLYGIIQTKRFPLEDRRTVGRFIKKWRRKIDAVGQQYDVQSFIVETKPQNPIVETKPQRGVGIPLQDFIMRRFTVRM